MEVRGRDQVAGLPRTISITSSEVTDALAEPLGIIANTVKAVLEKTPPELASDIIDRGMLMAGGGAMLRNLDAFLTEHTGVPCHVAENPMLCTAWGRGVGWSTCPFSVELSRAPDIALRIPSCNASPSHTETCTVAAAHVCLFRLAGSRGPLRHEVGHGSCAIMCARGQRND